RVTFRISTEEEEGGEDIRETIFFAFAGQRLPILSMQTTKASLEEVFLELTGEGETEVIETGEGPETDDFEEEPSEADFKEEDADGEGDEE
ncbi:MAG: ABC transporter, partial [Hungatella sp.]|nr:ABC transporter [Hungatella sp.]